MSKQITQILNIEKPIIQGPMAWSSFAPLVIAVSNAGGLGVLGIAGAPATLVEPAIKEVKSKTDKPFGINVYLNEKVVKEILPVLLKEKPDVVICTGVLAMIPICLIAKIAGKKLIYIESFAKVTSPTKTGKLLYKFADQFYVQWKPMLEVYPEAIYLGGIY